MTSPQRVALIGCGAVAEAFYRPALHALERTGMATVDTCIDPDPDRRRVLHAAFPNSTMLSDFEQLPIDRIDLAVVASPPRVHADQAVALLEQGTNVLCEKPMANTVAECEAMIEAAAGSRAILAVGHMRRFFPSTAAIKAILDSEMIGPVRSFECFEGGAFDWPVQSSTYFADDSAGGVLHDLGPHALDLLRWWWGDAEIISYEDDALGGLETNARLEVGFEAATRPFTGTVRLSRDWDRPNTYVIDGERGWIRWQTHDTQHVDVGIHGHDFGLKGQIHVVRHTGGHPELGRMAPDFGSAFVDQLRNVFAACEGTQPIRVPGVDALRAMQVIERCYAERSPMDPPWLTREERQRAVILRRTEPESAVDGVPATRMAIVGANGFIGSRVTELMTLTGGMAISPIVRSNASMARLSRFPELDVRYADAFDGAALAQAFAGCDVVLHAITGDEDTIVGTVEPTIDAAAAAGVGRVVYLSTASVHGQSPPPGTDENSAIDDNQPIAYNNHKVRAERRLVDAARAAGVEVVILRPGIVYGPRSHFIATFADELLRGDAYQLHGGRGICNGIYVDNLIHAIALAAERPGIDGEVFIVGDDETATWADLYRPIAAAFGLDFDTLPEAIATEPGPAAPEPESGQLPLLMARVIRRPWKALPPGVRRFVATVRRAYRNGGRRPELEEPTSWTVETVPAPTADLERSALYRCETKLNHHKATRLLDYHPPVSFEVGSRRSVEWLRFAGYPVLGASGSGDR